MIEFREAQTNDLLAVVRVHRLAFPGFFLTRLGPRFLRRYYRLVMEQPGGVLAVAEGEGALAGFVAGSVRPALLYAEMKRRKLSFAWSCLPALLCSPSIIRRLLLNFRQVRSGADSGAAWEEGQAELTSIGVDPACSGGGVGRGLLESFLNRARELGASSVTLTTDAEDNEAVNGFYRKAGFSLRRVFTQGDGRRMNEYRYDLSAGAPREPGA